MTLRVSPAPHIRSADTTSRLMLDVIIALIPSLAAGIYFFGLSAGFVVLLCALSCVTFEALWQKLAKQKQSVGDLSALVTGILIGLNLPPNAAWWLPIIASGVAILLVKQLFGGIGDNFMNPALSARAVLLASWPARMTDFTTPTYFNQIDAVSSATPLAGNSSVTLFDAFMGNTPGCIGEVSKIAILLGFLYLLLRGTISWRIPVVFLGVTALFVWALGTEGGFTFDGDPLMAVCTGGVMFGAVFMATDYTTSPMSAKGHYIYAAGCGLLVAVIRTYGNYPEGVTYAILLMNIATPLIDKYVKTKIYGSVKANA